MWDCIVVGGGPAGLSAAVNLRQRNKSCLIAAAGNGALANAPLVTNLVGLPDKSGKELLSLMRAQAVGMGAQLIRQRIGNILPDDAFFWVNIGQDVLQCRTVVLACGALHALPLPGEEEYLGRGVSYCATCDGMLYRSRDCVVWGQSQDAADEAAYLAGIGVRVTFIAKTRPQQLLPDIPFVQGDLLRINGNETVQSVSTQTEEIPCDGVFILREASAPARLIPGLVMQNGFVQVDRQMATSIPGVFAAGDCTGTPLQAAKAIGEGQTAGLSAAAYCG